MEGPPSEEGRALAGKIRDYEARLSDQLKAPQPDDKAVRATRSSLRDKYVQLMMLDFPHACRTEAEQNLWRKIFYKRIESFRKQKGKAESSLGDEQKRERAEKVLVSLRAQYTKFLGEAKDFYRSLIAKLLWRCSVRLEGFDIGENQEGAMSGIACGAVRDSMLVYCQKCMVYLGDLERYDQLSAADSGKADWDAPAKNYMLASLLAPHIGNPYNQLAVLATYKDEDLAGIYCYARALLAATPCILARKNLDLLLDSNEDKYNIINKKDGQSFAASYTHAKAPEKQRRMHEFAVYFVRLHGLLLRGTELNEYMGLESSVLVDMLSLIGAIDQPTMLRMVIVCIFSASDLGERLSACKDEAQKVHLERSYNLALGLCFRFFTKLSIAVRGNEQHLAALCVMSDWLLHNLELVSATLPSERADNGKELRLAKVSLVEHLVDLISLTKGANESILEYRPLQEDVDLMGFAPLRAAHKRLLAFSLDGMLVGAQGVAVEKDTRVARLVRSGRLETLAQHLAAGAKPMLFYDSQTGDYSVEGVMQGEEGMSGLGVQSQKRGMLRQPGNDSRSCGEVLQEEEPEGFDDEESMVAILLQSQGGNTLDRTHSAIQASSMHNEGVSRPASGAAAVSQNFIGVQSTGGHNFFVPGLGAGSVGLGAGMHDLSVHTNLQQSGFRAAGYGDCADRDKLQNFSVLANREENGLGAISNEDDDDADNDDTFGGNMLHARAYADDGDLSMLAHKARAFAVGLGSNSASPLGALGAAPAESVWNSRGGRAPEQDEEVSEAHLDYLVKQATEGVKWQAEYDTSFMEEDDPEEEEIILFQPTQQLKRVPIETEVRYASPTASQDYNTSTPQLYSLRGGIGAFSNGMNLAQQRPNALWGGFGDAVPFGSALIVGEDTAMGVNSPLTWQVQPLIPTATVGAQAGLNDGSLEIKSTGKGRFQTSNPYVP